MDKIELVYNLYKDESIESRKFRAIVSKKYQLSDRDITNIYAKINNYQVKKYGKKIGKGSDVEYLSREECQKRSSIMRTIKYQKLNKEK